MENKRIILRFLCFISFAFGLSVIFLPIVLQSFAYARDNVAGRKVYEKYCVGCHGEKGDGNGPASKDLIVKPRDFRKGVFKFKTTSGNSLPAGGDLFRVISKGLPLTSMPAFKLMSQLEKEAVISYIKGFSKRWQKEKPSVSIYSSVSMPEYVGTPDSVNKGKDIFSQKCVVCHGTAGKGNGPAAKILKDTWGNPAKPVNFTYGKINRGTRVEDIYLSVTLGVAGAPMPSFNGSLSEEKRWHITSYILDLMGKI